ncbi:restriction endonuclease [Sphingobacterium sp.]|uniref:restriction endonuclease n=1 Tax=Sphingobacterium sp. TaxID=341027 RepID=UPI0031D266C3
MEFSDLQLSGKIGQLEDEIKKWLISRELWIDSRFTSFLDYHQDEPNSSMACVLILLTEGGLWNVLNGFCDGTLIDEFDAFVENFGFYRELYSSCVVHFYPIDDDLNEAYLKYFHWKWLTKIIQPNYTSLYNEIFEFFGKNPERFYDLHHRQFEVLISEIFSNQGYKTELGKGQGDGGVDVKLFYKDGVDQTVTYVQVKKYKRDLPIKLEAVQALSGIVHTENADGGIFITSSRYLPSAQKFADNKNSKIILKDASHVQGWCENINTIMEMDRSKLFSDDSILKILNHRSNISLVGKIITSNWGVGMVLNNFCIILKDEPNLALVMKIDNTNRTYIDPPHNFRGYEVPILDRSILFSKKKDNIFRARKQYAGNEVVFLFDDGYYTIWDGSPKYFDLID